jgi:hypothetical protein
VSNDEGRYGWNGKTSPELRRLLVSMSRSGSIDAAMPARSKRDDIALRPSPKPMARGMAVWEMMAGIYYALNATNQLGEI